MENTVNRNYTYSYKMFNPLFWHLREAIDNDDIRNIWMQGGSSSGKSYSACQLCLLFVFAGGGNVKVLRKTGASISDTIYREFMICIESLELSDYFTPQVNLIKCYNGCVIDFSGLDSPDKIKGLENYQWILLEEVDSFDYEDYQQITFRMRGKPKLKIIADFNPVSDQSWVKKKVFDNETWQEVNNHMFGVVDAVSGKVLAKHYSEVKGKFINSPKEIYNVRTGQNDILPPNTVWITSTYLNNFWVVGSPKQDYGFYDIQTIANYDSYKRSDYNKYRVYALGEWGSVAKGGEFLSAISGKHIKHIEFDPSYPVHVSIDNNVLPFVTIEFWQMIQDGGKEIRQFHEICAREPHNTTTSAARLATEYLKRIGYSDVVYLHGDASSQASNTIDDYNRSFVDKFIEVLETGFHVVCCIPKSNPSVALSGEFVNAVLAEDFDEVRIAISDSCSNSIDDYMNTKKDANGGIMKKRVKIKETGQTYEEHGHCTDAMRYVVVDLLKDEYMRFSNRRTHSRFSENDFMYFNANINIKYSRKLIFCTLNVEKMFVMAQIGVAGEHFDVLKVYCSGAIEDADIERFHIDNEYDASYFECDKQYIPIINRIREYGKPVFGRITRNYSLSRINTFSTEIKQHVRIRADYKDNPEYYTFAASMLDFDGVKNYFAMNLLSIATSIKI
jgi:PBSX family phage terminase large subunit